MKNLFCIAIFFLLAFPVSAEEPGLFLTNQNGVQTTQFESSDDIYVEGICLPANQDIAKIYITPDKTWQTGDNLSDVSGGIETFTASSDAKIPRTKIWGKPLNQGTYDVVIDTNNNFTLQDYEQSCVIGITGAGFRVGNPAPPPPPPPPAEVTPPSPPPVSTPPPSPSLSSEPSVVFSLDESVEVKSLANIRKSPGGILIETQTKGALGVVIGGPVKASLDGNILSVINNGNIPVYSISVEKTISGSVEVEKLDQVNLIQGSAINEDIGSEYEKVELVPIILVQVKNTQETYLCEKNKVNVEL